jgi:AsmA family protein
MGTMHPLSHKIGPKARAALALGTACAFVVVLFDWNWFRHPVEQYLQHRSHREVRIGHLDIDIGLTLEPTVHLRDVHVQNASWGSERPAAIVGAASFTFSLRSVWEGRPVISRLVLHDAEVSLERQADGLRNWRLRNPDDRGPGRIKVLRLEPHRVKLRLVRRDIGLDVTATTRPEPPGSNGVKSDASHPLTIVFEGSYGAAKFEGTAATSKLITLLETGTDFPVRARMTTGGTRLDFDGTVADLYRPSSIDGDLRLTGPTLAEIGPFFRASLPASHPFEVRSRIRSGNGTTSFARLHATIGSTALEGDVSIDPVRERPRIDAVLRSPMADLSDFGFLGDDAVARKSHESAARQMHPALGADRLRSVEAHVDVAFERVLARDFPELESLRFTADVQDRVAVVQPLDLGIAGGHVVGRVLIDLRQRPIAVKAKADIDAVRVERLLGRLNLGSQVAGLLNGHIDLRSRGPSMAALIDGVSGTTEVSMAKGTISNRLDARLALNGGKLLRLMFTGDRAIGIRDAMLAIEFRDGVGKVRTLRLDTDQSHTEGIGVIDLRTELLDILLQPQRKQASILALPSAIRLHGSLRRPEVSLVRRSGAAS